MGPGWCSICGGRHARPLECPGQLSATGAERHGWRVAVETPNGMEAYGVLVAPSLDVWRARILTYPNVLWTAPGGSVTLKFVGTTPQEAELRAITFIEAHIKDRGYARLETAQAPTVAAYQAEANVKSLAQLGPALRKMTVLPVRFGVGSALFTAMTGNLSASGLFLVTLAPFDTGTGLRVLIDLDTGPVGLKGEVVWKRDRPIRGRPLGMGVRLITPPEPYREYVIELP